MIQASGSSSLETSSSVISAGKSAFNLPCGFQRTLSGSGQVVTDSKAPIRPLHTTSVVAHGDVLAIEDTPSLLLARLERLSREGKLDTALDLVFDHIDDLLLAGHFDEVSRLLDSVAVEQLDPAILVGFLTITSAASAAIQARAAFVVRVRAHLRDRMPREELESVLQGLE